MNKTLQTAILGSTKAGKDWFCVEFWHSLSRFTTSSTDYHLLQTPLTASVWLCVEGLLIIIIITIDLFILTSKAKVGCQICTCVIHYFRDGIEKWYSPIMPLWLNLFSTPFVLFACSLLFHYPFYKDINQDSYKFQLGFLTFLKLFF